MKGRVLATVCDDPRVRWIILVAWMGLIFSLSAQSSLPDLTGGHPQWEEVGGHLGAYAVLALLAQRALAGAGVQRPARWAFFLALLYGLSDEFHQSLVPGRHPDPLDVATDVAGAAVALWVLARVRLLRRREDRVSPGPRSLPIQ